MSPLSINTGGNGMNTFNIQEDALLEISRMQREAGADQVNAGEQEYQRRYAERVAAAAGEKRRREDAMEADPKGYERMLNKYHGFAG